MKNANKSQIKVLIVEDEPILAELHADFIQRDPYIKALAIASTLADAKLLVDKLKPDLILLDNYLPDGAGIDLFEHIISHQLHSYVIFITAASDIETCSRAIRYGAFDYLIKPVSYDRLSHSLKRFDLFLYRQSIQKHVNQQRIDELFNLQTKDFINQNKQTKGIEELTLQKIKELFIQSNDAFTVDSVVEKTQLSRTTARRYLEYGVYTKFLTTEIKYGKIGRPERLYIRAKS